MLRDRPILDHQFQAEQIGKFQKPIDSERAGVRFDLGQTVLTDSQLCGQRALRKLSSAPSCREDLSQLGAIGQDLFHICTLIGIIDKHNVSG